MVLVQKWPFFQVCFFRQYRPWKCLLRYSRTKNACLGYNNKKFKKSKNWHFSKGFNRWFWSKTGQFSNFVFLCNIGLENFFYDILEQKNTFRGYKNKNFKKSNISHFSKGVNPLFWSINGHFSNFVLLGNIAKENVFYDILEKKNALLRYKNKKFKRSKDWHFSKGVNPWFWSKNGHFSNFVFLGNIGEENVFYDILERKTPF